MTTTTSTPAAQHAWPRLGSMSDEALAHDEAHPYDAYSGFMDPDYAPSEPQVYDHSKTWPSRAKRACGGISEVSDSFRYADRRAPRRPGATEAYWSAHQVALDCGATEREAQEFGDKAALAVVNQQAQRLAA